MSPIRLHSRESVTDIKQEKISNKHNKLKSKQKTVKEEKTVKVAHNNSIVNSDHTSVSCDTADSHQK